MVYKKSKKNRSKKSRLISKRYKNTRKKSKRYKNTKRYKKNTRKSKSKMNKYYGGWLKYCVGHTGKKYNYDMVMPHKGEEGDSCCPFRAVYITGPMGLCNPQCAWWTTRDEPTSDWYSKYTNFRHIPNMETVEKVVKDLKSIYGTYMADTRTGTYSTHRNHSKTLEIMLNHLYPSVEHPNMDKNTYEPYKSNKFSGNIEESLCPYCYYHLNYFYQHRYD